jgi:hypothetical protein
MIPALLTFLVVVLVVGLAYWAITKLLVALNIGVPPIVLAVIQIICVLVVVLALINLLPAIVGGPILQWPR